MVSPSDVYINAVVRTISSINCWWRHFVMGDRFPLRPARPVVLPAGAMSGLSQYVCTVQCYSTVILIQQQQFMDACLSMILLFSSYN